MHALARTADAYRDTGRPAEALLPIAEALDYVAQSGIVYYEAELHRLESELSLGRGDERSEACFRRAIEIARALQAKSFELRAAMSLARLWGEQGRHAESCWHRCTAGSPRVLTPPI